MIFAVNVVGDQMGGGLGRAKSMAVADVQDGDIKSWQVYDVGWDVLHDAPSAPGEGHDHADHGAHADHGSTHGCGHGAHHARIVRFMKEHNVEVVVSGHIGPPMAHTLDLMGVKCVMGATGDTREAIAAVWQLLNSHADQA